MYYYLLLLLFIPLQVWFRIFAVGSLLPHVIKTSLIVAHNPEMTYIEAIEQFWRDACKWYCWGSYKQADKNIVFVVDKRQCFVCFVMTKIITFSSF